MTDDQVCVQADAVAAKLDSRMIGLCLTCYSSGSVIVFDSKSNAICIPCKIGINGATK